MISKFNEFLGVTQEAASDPKKAADKYGSGPFESGQLADFLSLAKWGIIALIAVKVIPLFKKGDNK